MNTELTALENYKITCDKTFVDEMNKLIKATDRIMRVKNKRARIKRVRIHSIGEFYDYDYFLKWIEIMKYNPKIQFTAYVNNFEVLIKYKDDGEEVPPNLNLLLSFYPDTYDKYASKGVKKYVDDLFSELSTYYNAS